MPGLARVWLRVALQDGLPSEGNLAGIGVKIVDQLYASCRRQRGYQGHDGVFGATVVGREDGLDWSTGGIAVVFHHGFDEWS